MIHSTDVVCDGVVAASVLLRAATNVHVHTNTSCVFDWRLYVPPVAAAMHSTARLRRHLLKLCTRYTHGVVKHSKYRQRHVLRVHRVLKQYSMQPKLRPSLWQASCAGSTPDCSTAL
jgi:hypothetical protein